MNAPTLPEILARAAVDPDFRARLVAEPRAVAAELGIDVPEGTDITVLESTPDHIYLALPPTLPALSGELDDDALATVAGGAPQDWIVSGFCTWHNTRTGENIRDTEHIMRRNQGSL